jgi:hypothetical protein
MTASRRAKSGARGRVGLACIEYIPSTERPGRARKLWAGMVGVRIVSEVKRAMRAVGGFRR